MSATAMQGVIEIINASLEQKGETQTQGKSVVGTVEGDLHDIGKTIVVSLLKANGFEVKDLGRDVPVDRFIEEAEAFGADANASSGSNPRSITSNETGASSPPPTTAASSMET